MSEHRRLLPTMKAPPPTGGRYFAIDAGTFYLDDKGEKTPFADEHGCPFIGLLDGNGKPLPDGRAPHILEFKSHPEQLER